MEIKSLNGGTCKLKLRTKHLRPYDKSKSIFQYKIGQQLLQEYPHDIIFEEVYVSDEKFILDFFIPSVNVVVECHGKQHTTHIKHFHKTKQDFHKQQDTDQRKRNWCELNGFKLIEIYDE